MKGGGEGRWMKGGGEGRWDELGKGMKGGG